MAMIDFQLNSMFNSDADYNALKDKPIDIDRAEIARRDLRAWGVSEETPLYEMPNFAKKCGVGRVFVKDEGKRAPLKSFKSLGGAYALGEALRDHVEINEGSRPSYDELFAGRCSTKGFCAASVTDGNHGLSLSWGASLFGVEAKIYLPRIVSEDRKAEIQKYGPDIVRLDANYDDTFRQLVEDARLQGWSLIQDISTEDYMLPHQRVMEGYTMMADETVKQLGAHLPTHVFLQVGCGGMAASIMAFMLHVWTARQMPKFILLESTSAASTLESFRAGKPTIVGGQHDTIMVGIAVGETSYLPWSLFEQSAFAALSIDDVFAKTAMRTCADRSTGDPAFVSGETGACGMGSLLALNEAPEIKRVLGIDASSSVLVINTEADTDRTVYRDIVGEDAFDLTMTRQSDHETAI